MRRRELAEERQKECGSDAQRDAPRSQRAMPGLWASSQENAGRTRQQTRVQKHNRRTATAGLRAGVNGGNAAETTATSMQRKGAKNLSGTGTCFNGAMLASAGFAACVAGAAGWNICGALCWCPWLPAPTCTPPPASGALPDAKAGAAWKSGAGCIKGVAGCEDGAAKELTELNAESAADEGVDGWDSVLIPLVAPPTPAPTEFSRPAAEAVPTPAPLATPPALSCKTRREVACTQGGELSPASKAICAIAR